MSRPRFRTERAAPTVARLAACVQRTGALTHPVWAKRPASADPAASPHATGGKSAKRGIAYDLVSAADLAALSPGVSWRSG